MFPNEIKQILEKYQEHNKNELININDYIEDISSQLKKVRSNLSHHLADIIDSDALSNNQEDKLLSDLKVLKEYINSISFISVSTDNMEISEELVPTNEEQVPYPAFTRKVITHLITDDICPFDYAKLVDHYIYYTKIIDNKLSEESVLWHKCPACNKLFVLDYELEDFELENTNIILNEEKYNTIPEIDIYTVIVLSNTLKCASNHTTKDVIAKLPVLNTQGQISYININSTYCPTCNRYTILKDDFNAIAGIVTCNVIDETKTYPNDDENSLEFDNKNSILAQYGYNVQTKKDLSEQQRHIILSSLIEAQILNRTQVINHITTLIERGSKIPNWKLAVQKWKDDKKFVSEYQSDCLPEVVFNNIILKYRKQHK